MAIEKIRGCGYRKVGALYLCGTGLSRPCCGLPLWLKDCPMCGFKPPFTRGLYKLDPMYVKEMLENHKCVDGERCPICHPETEEYMGLMWVGKRDYTPHDFIREARSMGVSKRVGEVPKWLKFNETWVLLAHVEVPVLKGPLAVNHKPAVFYAFVPQRIEKLIWKGQATPANLHRLEKQGITPVIIPDGDMDHA